MENSMRKTIRFLEGLAMLMIGGISLIYLDLPPMVSALCVLCAGMYFYLAITERVE